MTRASQKMEPACWATRGTDGKGSLYGAGKSEIGLKVSFGAFAFRPGVITGNDCASAMEAKLFGLFRAPFLIVLLGERHDLSPTRARASPK
jgi:hypothetical protein